MMALNHFINIFDGLNKFFNVFFIVTLQGDHNKGAYAKTNTASVDNGMIAFDDPGSFQFVHPFKRGAGESPISLASCALVMFEFA